MLSQMKSNRKPSGGRLGDYRKTKLNESAGLPTHSKLGETKLKVVEGLGSTSKSKLLHVNVANVLDPSTKKYASVKIKTILENQANRHYARRNIITKGTIIETELGKAKVTSRPGQDGLVNAVLVQ